MVHKVQDSIDFPLYKVSGITGTLFLGYKYVILLLGCPGTSCGSTGHVKYDRD